MVCMMTARVITTILRLRNAIHAAMRSANRKGRHDNSQSLVFRQCRLLLDHETLHPAGPDLHFIDHVANHFDRRPFTFRGAMPDGVVIIEQCHAKDGWNLADLDSPLFLLDRHPFLPFGPLLVGVNAGSFNTRANSFIAEHRYFLRHFLARCSMSARPGLDMRAGFWPETLD